MTDKKIGIEFAPGCFDNFDGTQEELDAFVSEIYKLVESGELLEHALEHEGEFLMDSLAEITDGDQSEEVMLSNARTLH
jgi:hypothetical protein